MFRHFFSLSAAVLLCANPSFAITPSKDLCALLTAAGTPAARAAEFFRAINRSAYDNPSPDIREKMIRAAVLMLSADGFYANNGHGEDAIAHLWLLGVPRKVIAQYVAPLWDGYWRVHVMNEEKPMRNAFYLHALFQAAWFVGDIERATKAARHLDKIQRWSEVTLDAWEALEDQEKLWERGKQFAAEVLVKVREGEAANGFVNEMYAPIAALQRIKDPERKQLANQQLLEIAKAISNDSFFDRFAKRSAEEQREKRFEFYDLALLALRSRGKVVKRYFVSEIPEVDWEIPSEDVEGRSLMAHISDLLVSMFAPQEQVYQGVRDALVEMEDSERLHAYGQLYFNHRHEWKRDSDRLASYDTAFSFFVAAKSPEKAREVLDAKFAELGIIHEGRDLERMAKQAAQIRHKRRVLEVLDIFESQIKWETYVPKVERLLTEEPGQIPEFLEIPPPFRRVLSQLQGDVSVVSSHRERENPFGIEPLEEIANSVVEQDPQQAANFFLICQSPDGLIAAGDALIERHRNIGHGYAAEALAMYRRAMLLQSNRP